MPTAEDIARQFIDRGWTPVALGLDAAGKRKRPLAPSWQNLTRETALNQPWRGSKGIGILCGPASKNLAVIDLDDLRLAADTMEYFARLKPKVQFRFVWTGSYRGHFYVYEREPSASRRYKVRYKGKEVGVELRCAGNQVAAPPTPGYVLAKDWEPQTVDNVNAAWVLIERVLGVERIETGGGAAGYPRAWDDIKPGDRNNQVYVDAHQLCRAGMPEQEAERLLTLRFGPEFGKDFGEHEVRRTVQSAYTKARREHREPIYDREEVKF